MADQKKWWIEEFFFWQEPIGARKWSGKDFFWLPVENPGLAKWARGPALIYAAALAGWWLVNALLGLFTPGTFAYWGLIYVALWTFVTWGLIKMRPEAAIAGLVLAALHLIAGLTQDAYLLPIIIVWFFIQAVRGTFAFQRLAKLEPRSISGP